MARLAVLLRGINLAGRNRVSMPELRKALAEVGYTDVATYVQSGNVVLTSRKAAKRVTADVEHLLAERFGLDVRVVVRTRDELAKIVKRNPLGNVATDPKRYQVTFLESRLPAATLHKLEAVATEGEQMKQVGRELYAWHPDGLARSKLGSMLAGKGLGVTATARNWRTVTQLLELADADD
jgi:uncharacterized protein (DUF1697 family)